MINGGPVSPLETAWMDGFAKGVRHGRENPTPTTHVEFQSDSPPEIHIPSYITQLGHRLDKAPGADNPRLILGMILILIILGTILGFILGLGKLA